MCYDIAILPLQGVSTGTSAPSTPAGTPAGWVQVAGAGPGLGVIPEHLAEVSTLIVNTINTALSTLNTSTAVNISSAGYQQPGGAGAGPGRGPVQRQQPRHAHSHALLAQPGAGRGRAAAGAGQRPRRAARRRHQQAAGGDGGDVQVGGENSLVLFYILNSYSSSEEIQKSLTTR